PTANFHEREVYDMFGVVFLGHQNAAQVGMTLKDDAKHVVHFAFVEVGGRPDVDNAAHPGVVPGQIDFDHQLPALFGVGAQARQVVNNLQLSFVYIVDGGDVQQVVKSKPRVLLDVAEELRGLVR